MTEDSTIKENSRLKGDYFRIELLAPLTAPAVLPGQFVHMRIGDMKHRILRRPFSVADTDPGQGLIRIIYKIVGEGTKYLSGLAPGQSCNIMGPLGNGFTPPLPCQTPVLVAGGYGSAALYLLAKSAEKPGVAVIGARSQDDILLDDKYAGLGFDVQVSTEDGTLGKQGLVTALLIEILADNSVANPVFYACGPHGMLMAVGNMLLRNGKNGELSLDHRMCCGVGACFACVVKVKDGDSWRYARTCREGPVFSADQIYY